MGFQIWADFFEIYFWWVMIASGLLRVETEPSLLFLARIADSFLA